MTAAEPTRPKLLIVGAGIGGLTLACLLEAAKIEYEIFEKATDFKALGSAITLSSQTFTFLDQLGIYADIEKISKPFKELNVLSLDIDKNMEMKHRGSFNSKLDEVKEFGYCSRIMARPDLFKVLLSKVPSHKVKMGKKIVSIQQNSTSVTITAGDESQYTGTLLVGADGAYSMVRAEMYKGMKNLPPQDLEPLEYDVDCVVGVTASLDPEQYPKMLNEKCEFQVVLYKQIPVSVWYMPLTERRIGWMISEEISAKKKLKNKIDKNANNYKYSEWGPEAAMEMVNLISHTATPYGTLFQDIVDKSDRTLISKVMLEEKYFETWHHGRVVLLGDACHKVLPFGAQGAIQTMLDALILSNLLYDLPSNAQVEIDKLLNEYKAQRKTTARSAVKGSSGAGKLLHNQGFMADLTRDIVLNRIPDWMIRKGSEKVSFYRPQCTFLEFKENVGDAKVIKQEYSPRYLREQKAAAAATSAVDTKAANEAIVAEKVDKEEIEVTAAERTAVAI